MLKRFGIGALVLASIVALALAGSTQTNPAPAASLSPLAISGGGGNALTSNPLSQFAATTSAQLAATISDESGTAGFLPFQTTGTWTPVIAGAGGTSGQTYTSQLGSYIRTGKEVYATAYILLSNKGTITGNVIITPLPFPVSASGNENYSTGAVTFSNFATAWTIIVLQPVPGTRTASVSGVAGAAGTLSNNTAVVTADLTNTTFMIVTMTYQTP
jgi:hypothetical protein